MKSNHSLDALARAFLDAFVSRHAEQLNPLLDDDVDWVLYGQIDMFPFLGSHRGKPAAMKACEDLMKSIRLQSVECERFVVSGNAASALLQCVMRPIRSEGVVRVRIACFIRMQNGKVCDVRTLIDTFDLVEQTLGREINLPMSVAI